VPVLRVYRWLESWGSYGYFVPDAEAAESLAGMKRVRRWTGGGIVDHRNDWTYTLVIPRGVAMAEMRGAESYRVIHLALAEALGGGGVECEVAGERSVSPGGDCFQKAVEFDLLDGAGAKVAGAGQRRTAKGLLHQGSLALAGGEGLARRLAQALSREFQEVKIMVDQLTVAQLVTERYGTLAWRRRR
jgi:lipoate-protein ligase A